MVIKKLGLAFVLLVTPVVVIPLAHSANINAEVARAYNDGIVRCNNSDCAKYLYACFRTYGFTTIDEFLGCGSKASRLNGDQLVVASPEDEAAITR